MDVGLDGVHGAFDDEAHTDGSGQMNNDVDSVNVLRGGGRVHDGVDGVMKALVVFEVVDVLDAAGGKIVEHIDLVAAFEKSFGEVGADETRASRNEDFHNQRPPFAGPLLPAFFITS